MSGKGDWIPGTNDAAYSANFDQIDWTRRAREQAQRDAIITGSGALHVDMGAKIPSNQANAVDVFKRVDDYLRDAVPEYDSRFGPPYALTPNTRFTVSCTLDHGDLPCAICDGAKS